MSGLVPLPAKLTERRIRDASHEQRAAWLAELESVVERAGATQSDHDRLARVRAIVSRERRAAQEYTAPLPVGEQRETLATAYERWKEPTLATAYERWKESTLATAYERWKESQIAAGRETCDHGDSLRRTCLVCFDWQVWERDASRGEGVFAPHVRAAVEACDGIPGGVAGFLAGLHGHAMGDCGGVDVEAAREGKPVSWQNAGGPDECGHGYAAGIPCPRCDSGSRASVDVEETREEARAEAARAIASDLACASRAVAARRDEPPIETIECGVCGAACEWKGAPSALTHAECVSCGATVTIGEDSRVGEREDGEPWPFDDDDDDDVNEDTECGDCGSGKTGGLCLECDPHEMIDDASPTLEEAITGVSLSLQDAGCSDEEEAREEAERLVEIVKDAVADRRIVTPQHLDLRSLVSRVTALEQRPPVVAPPAIPADLLSRLEVAEGVADTARKAVEALAKRVDDAIAQGDGLYRALTRGTMSVSEAARAFDDASKGLLTMDQVVGPEKAARIRQEAQADMRALQDRLVPARPTVPVRTIRCSSLPLFRACAASAHRTPEMILVESAGEPARLGTAVHEVAAHMILRDYETGHDLVAEIAEKHDVDREGLGYLASQASAAWDVLRERFPRPTVEGEVSMALDGGARLDGHPDIYAIDGRVLRVNDIKSGRLRYDTREQLLGYALLVLWRVYGVEYEMLDEVKPEALGIDTVELYTSWLRPEHGGIQRLVFTVAEVLAWGRDLAKRATATPLPYSPGPHCVQCMRCADCPAKAAWVRQAVSEFAPGGTTAEALAAARAIEKVAKEAIKAIRTQAITTGIEGVAVNETRKVSVQLSHPAVPQAVREALIGKATAGGGDVRGVLLKVMGLRGPEADEEMARLEAAGAAKVTKSQKVAGEE